MKKVLSLLLAVILLFGLTSCGESDEVPDGMQLCRGGEDVGYYFYVPEEWTLSNLGNISAAYVSTVNPTSVSLTESTDGGVSDLDAYFEVHKADFPYTITLTGEPTDVKFGNAAQARAYVYDFLYNGHSYRTMQILAKAGGRFYIFTYNAYNEPYMSSGDTTFYQEFFDKMTLVTENVRFTEEKTAPAAPVYDFDGEGYALVSDKVLAGFDFYMPRGWLCDASSGIVRVYTENGDGASVVMSEATLTGMSVSDYWEKRKSDLAAFVDNLTIIKPEGREEEYTLTPLGNARNTCRYEYTYVSGGVTYHVIQYLAVSGMHGYVFTFTVPESAFDAHREEAETMAQKVHF